MFLITIFFNKIHIFPFQNILHLFLFLRKILLFLSKVADRGFAPPPSPSATKSFFTPSLSFPTFHNLFNFLFLIFFGIVTLCICLLSVLLIFSINIFRHWCICNFSPKSISRYYFLQGVFLGWYVLV